MTIEAPDDFQEYPMVDPKEFLKGQFVRVEVGRLLRPPNKALLRWLPRRQNETGLVFQRSRWLIIKSDRRGVPANAVPGDKKIFLHSHPNREGSHDPILPSLNDYKLCSAKTQNFVVSQRGLTQFWPVEQEEDRQVLSGILCPAFPEWHLSVLNRIHAKFQFYPWEELDEEKIAQLLTPLAIPGGTA